VLRERDVVLRARVPLLRGLAPDFARGVDAATDLPPPLERFAPVLDDFARVVVDLRAPDLALDVDALERVPVDFRLAPPRDELEVELLPVADSSVAHLPESTRCAASATASAIKDPSFVALDITFVAA
jgi:hypothetical protein